MLLPHRLYRHGPGRLPLFLVAQYTPYRISLAGNHTFLRHLSRATLCTGSCTDRRTLWHKNTLHRSFARLSTLIHHRWRPRPTHRRLFTSEQDSSADQRPLLCAYRALYDNNVRYIAYRRVTIKRLHRPAADEIAPYVSLISSAAPSVTSSMVSRPHSNRSNLL